MALQVIDPLFCDVEHNLGQHYVAACQESVVAAVDAVSKGNARDGSGGPLRLSDCAQLSVGLKYLRQNVDCIFTNMKSYPLLMQVYNVLLEEKPTDASIWRAIAEVSEQIGDYDAAAAQYSSHGHALLKYSQSNRNDMVAAVVAFNRAVELAPEVCEYRYWLADAKHAVWSAERGVVATSGGNVKKQVKKISKTKSQPGGDNKLGELREACHQLEETLDCVSSYRDLHDNQPYPAHLDGHKTG